LTNYVLPLEVWGEWLCCDAPGCDKWRIVTYASKDAFKNKPYTCDTDLERPMKGCHWQEDEQFLQIAKTYISGLLEG
jgi:hypothetical protein